jgi:hypothetical protein
MKIGLLARMSIRRTGALPALVIAGDSARPTPNPEFLRQFLDWCGLLGFVQGRRSLMVATTLVQWVRDISTQELR